MRDRPILNRSTSEKFARAWHPVVCLVAIVLPCMAAPAQIAPTRYPITTVQVLDSMRAWQLPTDGVQISLSTPITAASANPGLEVQSANLLDPHSAHLKLSCHNHADCLPFYVSAFWPKDAETTSLSEALNRHAPPKKPSPSTQPAPALSRVQPVEDNKPEPDFKAGTPATLMLTGDRIQIRVKVVCLESGSTGDKIRVATPDRKQTYVAEIVTPTSLKGSF